MNSFFRIFITVSIGISFYYTANAQTVIWFENFNENPCTSLCTADGYNGNGGSWTETFLGTIGNGYKSNEWYVSCAENGNAVGACGSGCAGKNTLHVGNVAGSPESSIICPKGDCGAIYDFGGGTPSTGTLKRAESPTINGSDFINDTLWFNYMANGENNLDLFSLWWYDGTNWGIIDTPAKTSSGSCPSPHYGTWTRFYVALPSSANNNANVKIGFVWQNNNNGTGSDPSVAIDSIRLTGTFILPPIAGFAPSQNNFCENTCIDFTDTSTHYPTSWLWSFPGGNPSTSTAQNPTNICFNTSGNYPVILTATNANGNSNDTITIIVDSCTKPKAAFSIQQPQPICYGTCVELTNNSQDATSYSWNFGGAATPNTSTAENPTICFNQNGTFHILLTATNNNGSDTVGQDVTVMECLNPAFIVTVTSICSNDCVSFTDQTTGNPTAWDWSFEGATPHTSTQQNPATVCYTDTGVYAVKLTVSNGGGSDSLTKTNYITVIKSPVGTISNDTSIKLGGSAQLTATGGISYQWTPTIGLSDSSIATPIATPSFTTAYTVNITGANGCSIQEHVVVTVIQPQLIFVPDAFTPNGDGVNDIFKVYTSLPISTGDLRVFDQWGELLYETTNLTQGWDGTYKGKAMDMGVFVYWYRIVFVDGTAISGKGDITLLR